MKTIIVVLSFLAALTIVAAADLATCSDTTNQVCKTSTPATQFDSACADVTKTANCLYYGTAASAATCATGRKCLNTNAGYTRVASTDVTKDDTFTCATGYTASSDNLKCNANSASTPSITASACAAKATPNSLDANCASAITSTTNCVLYGTSASTAGTGRHCLQAQTGFFVYSTAADQDATAATDDSVCSSSCSTTSGCTLADGTKCFACATGYAAPSGTTTQSTTGAVCTATSFGQKLAAGLALAILAILAIIV